ncbi:hypothetical protein CCS79_12490 [Clostridium diolis]|uniref:glycosyltransferase family 4 protein n=1 Tax=Clostridium diolis TaxID=223919 RepID=UPI000B401461|nr:glycosyltransferase family 4 protein [Clostridium diolis]OVE67768.1 hypothetical protein CCS79_12490 [Clostridium diolis]
MKRVAIITNIPSPYRVDFFYYLQTNYIDYKFYIIYSSTNEDNRSWDINEEKVLNSIFLKSRTIKIKKSMDIKYIHIPRDVEKTLNEIKPDVVIGSEYNPTILKTVRWCKKQKISYVSWTDGTLNSEKNINFIQKLSRKYVIRNSSTYIASSAKSREAQIYYGANPDKIFISYLTVDINAYIQRRVKNDNFQIIFVGRLVNGKGIELLLKALSKINYDYKLIIAGDGDELCKLKHYTRELEMESKVNFTGFLQREELKKYYSSSSLFVLPTLGDCYGLVILEAMCASLPVIASIYADGAKDLIEEGKNGYIIDPYDTENFTKIIEELMNNNNLLEYLSKNAYLKTSKFKFSEISIPFVNAINLAAKIENE